MPGIEDLRPYQLEGTKFMMNRGAALLGDQPGLGKTPMTITALRELGDEIDRVLVFAPKSMLYTWAEEIQAWDPDAKSIVLTGSTREKHKLLIDNYSAGVADRRYFITNYETLQGKNKLPFERLHWAAVVADEAHYIKNRKAQRTKNLKKITNVGKRKIRKYALTGTPFANSPDEIWSLLNWLDPKRWSSYWKFVNTYMHVVDTPWGRDIVGVKYGGATLSRALLPYMKRRLKSEVLPELPEKQYQYIWTDISKTQHDMYEELKKNFLLEYGDVEIDASDLLSQMTRFRQLVVSPKLIDPGLPDDSPRLDAIAEYIANMDEPVLVLSNYVMTLDLLEERINKVSKGKMPVFKISGATPGHERTQIVSFFQHIPQGDRATLIGTIGAMGLGLTLHRASTVVFVDRSWSPIDNEQAEDRVHRFGQKNSVNVVVFGIPGTVDERVTYKLIDKNKEMRKVIAADIIGVPPKPGKPVIVNTKT